MGPLTPVIESVLQDLKKGVKKDRATLQDFWPQIVGNTFASQTKGSLERNGTLCIWVSNSTLAYELSQKYVGTLLKRAQEILGEEVVRKVIFRVGEIR
ncbi:MAG: DUF721 domain-containing protein [Candidatus Omnitrophica bacterium]|nr:DUF721 domain-containing protein [Candidatus Omnitrophota bacterium]